MLRLADARLPTAIARAAGEIAGSAADSVGSAGEPLPPPCVRPLGVGSRLLGGPSGPLRPRAGAFAARILRSASPTPTSAVRARAPTPGCSRRGRRRLRRNPSAGFRNRNVGFGIRPVTTALDPLAPGTDSSSRELIHRVRNPICRLRRRIGCLRCSMRHLGAITPTPGTGPSAGAEQPE